MKYANYILSTLDERKAAEIVMHMLSAAADSPEKYVSHRELRKPLKGLRVSLPLILKGLRNEGRPIGSRKQGSLSYYYLAETRALARAYAKQMNLEIYSEMVSRIRSFCTQGSLDAVRERHILAAIEIGSLLNYPESKVRKDCEPVIKYHWLHVNGISA